MTQHDRDTAQAPKPASKMHLISMSKAELMVRMMERMIGIERPAGATPQQALASIDQDELRQLSSAADAAAEYFGECLGAVTVVH